MAQEFLTSVKVKDFIKGVFTLERPSSPIVKGGSAQITIKKRDDKIIVLNTTGEHDAYIKNFTISLITDSNFICNITWDGNKETNKYRLYQDGNIIQEEIYNNFKIDFSNYQNGNYIFKLDCLEQSNFVKRGYHGYEYTYPFLTIPIKTNYKYYFYYGIENWDEDLFLGGMLVPTAIDTYGAKLIEEDKAEWLDDKHTFDGIFIDPLVDNGVFMSDNYMYFTDDDYSYAGYPPAYFVLDLDKIPGIDDVIPIIKEINIYIEKISEDDEDIEEDIGGDF